MSGGKNAYQGLVAGTRPATPATKLHTYTAFIHCAKSEYSVNIVNLHSKPHQLDYFCRQNDNYTYLDGRNK